MRTPIALSIRAKWKLHLLCALKYASIFTIVCLHESGSWFQGGLASNHRSLDHSTILHLHIQCLTCSANEYQCDSSEQQSLVKPSLDFQLQQHANKDRIIAFISNSS